MREQIDGSWSLQARKMEGVNENETVRRTIRKNDARSKKLKASIQKRGK